MHWVLIFSLVLITIVSIFSDEEEGDEDDNFQKMSEEEYFINLPPDIKISYENATSFITSYKHDMRAMGVSNKECDNARDNLTTDFDPRNENEIRHYTECTQPPYSVNLNLGPTLTIVNMPDRYMPIHRCMHYKLEYLERIPIIAPHRPLWALYGEYQYLPPQRWLHNLEHGAIIALYHPCADSNQVQQLKDIVKGCLFRHVITPFLNLTAERPIALVGWAAYLEMAHFDYELSRNFIKFYARSGPERVFRDGQYRHLIKERAKIVTNIVDSEVCPGM